MKEEIQKNLWTYLKATTKSEGSRDRQRERSGDSVSTEAQVTSVWALKLGQHLKNVPN